MKKILLMLACVATFSQQVFSQNIGIGTNDPKSKLDINGGLALREGPVLTLVNGGASGGANDNVVLPDISTGVKAGFYRIVGPTAAFSVFGIVPSTGADGQLVTLVNTTSNTMTIKNNASSNAVNGFKTLTGSDMVSVAGNSSITIQYNKTDSRWYVTGSQNYVVTTGSISTGDITTNNTAISMTNNTGRLVGTAAMTIDVATNGLNQKGIVPGPTGGNGNQVWGTDVSGNPAWQKVNNNQLTNNSITVSNGSGISVSGSPVALGGTVTVTNSAPDQTVVLNNGTGINTTGTYPNFTINNTGDLSNTNEAQTLAGSGTADINLTQAGGVGGGTITLQGSGATSVTRNVNTFTISSTNSGGTVTNIATNNGITGGPITTTGTIGLTGNALAMHNLGTGMVAITGAGTAASRSVAGSAGRINVTNGNGVAGDPTVDLATAGTAGTYTKVTTDAYGRVTSGTTLAAGDVPSGSNNYIQNQSSSAQSASFWVNGTAQVGSNFTNLNGRLLTSNASGWVADGVTPQMVISNTTTNTNRASVIGLDMHNDGTTVNTYSPFITFSRRSNSTSYNSAYAAIGAQATGQGTDANWVAGDLMFATEDGTTNGLTEKMRITSGGNVFFPQSKTEIYTTDRNHMIVMRGDQAGTVANENCYYQYGGTLASALGHRFFTGGAVASQTEKMRISDDGIYMAGPVGIGTAGPGYKLDVNGSFRTASGSLTLLGDYIYVSPTNNNTFNSGYSSNSLVDMWLNYRGYQDGMTQFRNMNIGDGKGQNIAWFDGTNHRMSINNNQVANYTLDVNGTTKTTNFLMTSGATNGYVLKSDASGNASWVAPGSIGAGDNLGNHTATTTLAMAGNTIDNANFMRFTAGDGNGIRFWQGDNNYAIEMGNAAENHYGPVTDYSIKMHMNGTSGRGWTWGVNGQTPVAGIENLTGNMQIKGNMTFGNYLLGNAKQVVDATDSWLRLNQAGNFGSGIYSPGFLRVDGGFASGGLGSLGAGTIHANGQVRAPIYYDYDNTGYYADPASTSNLNVLRFNVSDCINGTCPPNNAIRMTPNFHLNSGAGYGVILNWDNGTTGATQTFRIGNGAGSDVFYVYADGQAFTNNWWRSLGNTGWYSQSYGGGWWMTDGSYLRTYGDKQILATGGITSQGTAVNGTLFGANASIYANNGNVNGGGIMVSDDGGFFDYNDAWIQSRVSNGIDHRSSSGSWNAIFTMGDVNNSGTYDKLVATRTSAWGLLGGSSNAWWQTWSYYFNAASLRELKKDIAPVKGSLSDLVMNDIDKLHPYLYRYKVETDEWKPGLEAKYHPGLHMGLIVDDAPDYVLAQSYQGVDVYAVATLGVAAGKANREEIKQIKQSIGLNNETMTVQDFGSKQMSGTEMFVPFNSDFSTSLGSEIPAVTVTSNVPGVTLSITEKNAQGFKVVSSSAQNVSFDYIAMAKVKNTLAEKREEIAPEVMSRVRVSDDVKAKVSKYWSETGERLTAVEEKARQDAKAVAAENAKRTAVPAGIIGPDKSPKAVITDPAKAQGYKTSK